MNDGIDNDLIEPYVTALKCTKTVEDLAFNSRNIDSDDELSRQFKKQNLQLKMQICLLHQNLTF